MKAMNIIMYRTSIILLALLFSNLLYATTIYVTPNGAGALDGSSWTNAYPGGLLQTAIDNASNGDSVWVACGTYFPTANGDRSSAFSMRNNISIFGSFQGTESFLEERQFTCGACSILSGNIGNSGIASDNSYTVIVNNDLDNSAIIDGFEVADGYDDRSVSYVENGLGGGVYNGGHGNNGFCSPTFRNMIIVNNFAVFGAGMFNNGYNGGNSSPILINCIIAFNTATNGGGGMDSNGWNNGNVQPTLINCIMYGNHANDRGGAIYCWGGLNGNCTTTINNTVIINNTSGDMAGGIIVDNSDNLPGSPSFSGTAEIINTNSIFWGNTASSGPQFYIRGSGQFIATYSNIDTVDQTNAHPITGNNEGNLFIDPLFININSGKGIDDCWMTDDDGLNLTIASPNINGGIDSTGFLTDLKNCDRISGASIDIGSYEYQLLDSVVWTGDVSTIWEDYDNWLPQRSPDSTQHVTISENLVNYPIILDDIFFIKELLMGTNSQLHISGIGMLNVVGN